MAKKKDKDKQPGQTGSGFTVTLLACFAMIGYAVFVANSRRARERDEATVVAELRANMDGETKATRGVAEFPPDLVDPYFTADLQRTSRQLHGPISHCTDGWPEYPAITLVRVTTDVVGDLATLAVQGAPASAEECLVMVLSKGSYPRDIDAVAELRLDPSGSSIEEVGGVTESVPDSRPRHPKKARIPRKPGSYTTPEEGY